MIKNYYELTKEQQFLANDNPYNIGGRSTDISQIYYSLKQHIAEKFEDCVPDIIRYKLSILQKVSLQTEDLIQEIISDASDFAGNDRMREPCGRIKI